MRSCLAFFVFIFVFVPLAFCGLLTASVSTWITDRSFYTDLFSASGIYAALLGSNLDYEVSLQVRDGQRLDPETTDAFSKAIQEVAPPNYIRDEVVRNINAVFDYLEDFSRGLALTWDLRPLKENLTNEQIVVFADVLVKSLPPCSPQNPQEDFILPTCLPADKSAQEVTTEVRAKLPRFVESLPDFQPLGDAIPPNTERGAVLGDPVRFVLGSGVLSTLVVVFFTWLAVAFLAARSTKGIFSVLGSTLLVPAVPVLLIGITIISGVASNTVANGIDSALIEAGLQSSPDLRSATLGVVTSAISRVANGFLIYGGGAMGLAVLLLVVSAFMPQPRKRKPKNDDFNSFSA